MPEIDPKLLDTELQLHILQALENTGAIYTDASIIPVPSDISLDKMSHNVHYLKISGYIEELPYIGSNVFESGKLRLRITHKGKIFLTSHR